MTKLEVFKGSANNLGAIMEVEGWAKEFIADKNVVSTDVVTVGEYLFIYVWYQENIEISIDLNQAIDEFNTDYTETEKRIQEGRERMEKKRERFDKEFGR